MGTRVNALITTAAKVVFAMIRSERRELPTGDRGKSNAGKNEQGHERKTDCR
jgi:hypothetical protein